jgi:phosphoribosyl 1,2-cyclic phosphodiesterase
VLSLSVLGSGSHGNSVCIWSDDTAVLIDGGLNLKQTKERLRAIGRRIEKLTGVLLTHEHGDHANHVGRILEAAPRATLYMGIEPAALTPLPAALEWLPKDRRMEFFQAGDSFPIGGFEVETFPIPHDAAAPVGFAVKYRGLRYTVALDTGYVCEEFVQAAAWADVIVMEANHDLQLLMNNESRPMKVRKRTAGREGHLSNGQTADYLRGQFGGVAQHVVLAHLSAENNTEGLVKNIARRALDERGFEHVQLHISTQGEPTEALTF